MTDSSAPSLTFHPTNPSPRMFNPPCNSPPDLSTALSSLNNLIHLSHRTFYSLPSLLRPHSQNPNPNLVQCPFNHHHLMPPEFLFLHYLRCPSSPHPLPNPDDLLHSLSYPKTLQFNDRCRQDNCFQQTLHDPHAELLFSLEDYVDVGFNFFYHDCPGVVTLSDVDAMKRTFTLPGILSIECFGFVKANDIEIKYSEREHLGILPSEYWTIKKEVDAWDDYPTTCSHGVLRAIGGVGITKACDFMRWIMANSPRYGVVIDMPMGQHIFLLFSLCLKSILREALNTLDVLNNQLLELDCSECPVLVRSSAWLTSQISILYGSTKGKLFVLDLLKMCTLDGASALLLYTFGKADIEAPPFKEKFRNQNIAGMDMKGAKYDILQEGNAHSGQNNVVDGTICSCNVSISQVAAAIAALHERSLLEDRMKRLWFSQQSNKFQLVAEHCYLTEKANEERKKRPNYRAVIDYDGLPRQQSSNMGTTGVKTREELLAEERDYKRRRMSYRGKKIKRSTVQVMRDIIEEYMEEIKQAGGVGSPMKQSDESGMLPLESLSRRDMDIEAKILRKGSRESSVATVCNPSHYEQKSRTIYCDKSKAVEILEDASPRDYEQPRQGHSRKHGYIEAHGNTVHARYGRKHASGGPEGPNSYGPSNDSISCHRKHDYSRRKKYDEKSRSRDRWQGNSHRNHDYDSPLKRAFEDRYDPSESLDLYEDNVSPGTKR
ncbi:U11/U12 small nuclear ribonucleoprotein 48 kDa protein [Neltuma alba]|uniref:U11/U12 small nuclear ribonucleoprotein 48 kDa protein n=1 Tax=Neltuma alba TaxID=207710 RepID=UPI0010A50338|nr:U11/U12 small nuclear ribonucleoprotein 48 kDa protein-like [Prosopis alba]XP_028770638.1 U11/U12 small nuclear ribonucleoprotein 48 kDa protein-like [Prosopis alba]XP_028770694.1 U11/U12 small nuclear ribonucleoprotein 48 kDa protein [Prosopis alba]XP_028770695.1 U11/U12 small nuclear ribonucleoprotein 48 kDa protein [Prosopis alba]